MYVAYQLLVVVFCCVVFDMPKLNCNNRSKNNTSLLKMYIRCKKTRDGYEKVKTERGAEKDAHASTFPFRLFSPVFLIVCIPYSRFEQGISSSLIIPIFQTPHSPPPSLPAPLPPTTTQLNPVTLALSPPSSSSRQHPLTYRCGWVLCLRGSLQFGVM